MGRHKFDGCEVGVAYVGEDLVEVGAGLVGLGGAGVVGGWLRLPAHTGEAGPAVVVVGGVVLDAAAVGGVGVAGFDGWVVGEPVVEVELAGGG